MKADPKILAALQAVLTMELTGINQYFLHSKMAKSWGYLRLARFEWDESMDEMRHADQIIDRMLYLDGQPNMTSYDKVVIGKDVKSMLAADLALEHRAMEVLRASLDTAFALKDHGSRELFEHILVNEEEHIDWLETQLQKIQTLGLEHWLAHQQFEGEATKPA